MLPLDLHAHIQPNIAPEQLLALRSCVVGMTRSLDEFDTTVERHDPTVIWAVGCHPGLAKAVRGFSVERFGSAILRTPVVGEVGLDRSSRVAPDLQRSTFVEVLRALRDTPRLISIHSSGATTAMLEVLSKERPRGAILHWWLGDDRETQTAIELGAYFSVNASQARRWPTLGNVPLSRVLLETDHPFGDRSEKPPRRPGNLINAETYAASRLGTTPAELRRQTWLNLKTICLDLGLVEMFPREFQVQLLAS